MDMNKELERITDKTIILQNINIRELKRKLKGYKEELEEQGKTKEEIGQLIVNKFKELKNENIKT